MMGRAVLGFCPPGWFLGALVLATLYWVSKALKVSRQKGTCSFLAVLSGVQTGSEDIGEILLMNTMHLGRA